MPSVFLPKGRKLWHAKIRVSLPSGKPEWRRIATGCRDRENALAAARAAEAACGVGLDRERAERLVETLLELTGGALRIACPSLLALGNELFDDREKRIGESTRRKYAAHWKRFQQWAGDRMHMAVDRWTGPELRAYYAELRREFCATTANNHMTSLSMVFMRAQAAGHIRGNPVDLVGRVSNDSAEKRPLFRVETGKLLRAMRHDAAWRCLVHLGWATGHRLADLLALTKDSLGRHGKLWTVSFQPGKKAKRGGRKVVLPIPATTARLLHHIGNFRALNNADNRNGRVSTEFVEWMKRSGIDPLPVKRGPRTIHLKSFHSFRHAMASRLAAAGVSPDLARMVTDHESAKVAKVYQHAEVTALAEALKKVQGR